MIDMKTLTKKELAGMMDYSILPKNTQEKDIREGCAVAREYRFAAFYSSSPYWTPLIKEELQGCDDIEIGTGIAFPFGSTPASVKALEVEESVKRGCTTVDMVMNIGALKDKRYKVVEEELELFVKAAGNAVTKCILEVCYLTNEEITAGSKLIEAAGIQYAKTSTGQFDGPDMDQFLIMRDTLAGSAVKLKAAGVKFPRPQNALVFIKAGAVRIGTRAAIEIVEAYDTMKSIGLIG
ncbi:MAG: deoxyribose-phosphate aldolase [Kiritimatiellaeota bacterium]|nr:deoxyribose-phosphate aldolase [Kiritimatiellota bacterium]